MLRKDRFQLQRGSHRQTDKSPRVPPLPSRRPRTTASAGHAIQSRAAALAPEGGEPRAGRHAQARSPYSHAYKVHARYIPNANVHKVLEPRRGATRAAPRHTAPVAAPAATITYPRVRSSSGSRVGFSLYPPVHARSVSRVGLRDKISQHVTLYVRLEDLLTPAG